MNDTDSLAIVDTDRDELRDRIDDTRQRFYRLALAADPDATRRGLDWTVHQIVAHMLSVAQRYQAIIEGRSYRRANNPRELDRINREQLEEVMAPIPELIAGLQALEPTMDDFFDALPADYSIEFHAGATVSGVVVQVNWLLELVLHGDDIARAAGIPWEIRERDMLLLMLEAVEVAPAYLRSDIDPATDISVALQIPDARPYVIHVHEGIAEMRARRPEDRPDAVLKASAATAITMLLNRIGPVTAARRGLRIVGGRRPWKAMKLQSCFETA